MSENIIIENFINRLLIARAFGYETVIKISLNSIVNITNEQSCLTNMFCYLKCLFCKCLSRLIIVKIETIEIHKKINKFLLIWKSIHIFFTSTCAYQIQIGCRIVATERRRCIFVPKILERLYLH